MFFERIFYVYSPSSCLPTLLTLSTAEGFPIKQIAPRNPSSSAGPGQVIFRGEAHLLLTRGLDNMVSVKVDIYYLASVNIVNKGVTPVIGVSSIVYEPSRSAWRRPACLCLL